MKKLIILALISLPIFCTNVAGQSAWGKLDFQTFSTNSNNEDDVTLVVSGDGKNKEEATKVALRSAIEQVYGCFVSSDFKLLNDNVTQDEIVTISSGNIKSYQELSYTNYGSSGSITLKATVSRSRLISFAKSKGASAELAGATFGMNMKLKELNRKNELDALKHLAQVVMIYLPFCYDLTINVGKIKVSEHFRGFNIDDLSERWKKLGKTFDVSIKVTFVPNTNAEALNETFWNTLNALVLSSTEVAEYKNLNLDFTERYFYERGNYYFRNSALYKFEALLAKAELCELFNFEIIDNLGQKTSFSTYFDFGGERSCFNITPLGNAIIEPWSYKYDAIDWRATPKITHPEDHYMTDAWLHLSGYRLYDVNFNKEMSLDITLKIPQEDISKYEKFDIRRKTGNLADLILKSPIKSVDFWR